MGEVGVIAIFNKLLFESKKIKIFGSESNTRDYIYINDAVKMTLKSMNSGMVGNFNIGSGISNKTSEIIRIFKKYYPKLKYTKLPERQNEIKNFQCSLKKTSRHFGTPTVSLENGIGLTIRNYRNEYC